MLRIALLAALAVVSWIGSAALAETITFNGQSVDVSTLPADIQAKIKSGEIKLPAGAVMSGGMAPAGGPNQPTGDAPKPGGDAKDGEKKDGDKPAEDGPATIKRTNEDGKADPEELKAKPDKDGMVQFSFRGQPWADVLQWYAEIAKCSLDWQELPSENLNLVTQRRHSIAETRNLLNRYLLARGFTMLHQGDVLTVAKLDKIDPSLVPRINEDDLEDHLPYDFGRVRFALPDTMDPAKAVDDVKILLNPSAKPTVLLASKQIMVIDAVANLRDVRELLNSQKLAALSDVRPEMFQVRHRRADYIADQIMIVLGLDPSSRKTPMELQLEQQRMQLLMQMQQQGKDITNMIKQDGPKVFIAVDRRRNTVSVNAPPQEMAIIKRVVEQFDVPGVGAETAEEPMVTKRYQTVTVSPDSVVSALKEIANLSPLSQLQSDAASKTIFATGSAADHQVIKGMIDKLDGSGREMYVIWLSRRTAADQVAGTIHALMVGEKKEQPQRPWYYYGYGNQQTQEPDTGFRIQADVENNRMIMMATPAEYDEVTRMLGELGVVMSERGGNPQTFRVLDARDPKETEELLKRLREAWGGRNELNIQVAPPAATKPADQQPKPAADEEPADGDEESEDTLTDASTARPLPRRTMWLAQFVEGADAGDAAAIEAPASDAVLPETEAAPADEAAGPEAEAAAPADPGAPPINLTVTPDGRIILSSDDAVALDRLEDLLAELAPPAEGFKFYKLKNTDCRDVWYNLTDYFKEDLAADDDDTFMRLWNGFGDEKESTTLGRRRKLRFIWDTATNSILVQNASPAQLHTVDKLIEIYDQPVADDAVRQRKTAIVQVKYSRAVDIATAIKDVYRDLLSSKDKEFQDRNGNQRGSGRQEIYYRFPGMSDSSKSTPVKMAFEGALSIGVDEVSNSLIISAEEQIFDSVKELVTSLDNEALPDTVVQVYRITGSLDAEELEDALEDSLSSPWMGGKPGDQAGVQNGRGGGEGFGRGGGGGGRGRWRNRGGGGDDND